MHICTLKQTLFPFTHTVWEVLTPDPSQRALSMGLEVMGGAPIVLIHCATQKPLVVRLFDLLCVCVCV